MGDIPPGGREGGGEGRGGEEGLVANTHLTAIDWRGAEPGRDGGS